MEYKVNPALQIGMHKIDTLLTQNSTLNPIELPLIRIVFSSGNSIKFGEEIRILF